MTKLKLTKKDILVLEKIGDLQMYIQDNLTDSIEYKYENLISFSYKEQSIINPVLDETGRFEVDPIEYYGNNFLNSDFIEFI